MKHYSLFELNKEISEVLSANLEPSYWVIAEISQVQVNQKGHCYLEIVEKESNQIKAKMRATIWSYTYRNLITWFENMTRQTLKPGMEILFNAVIQYHEVYGMSLNIKDIDANYTLGERARKRTETIEQLKEDGVFDMNRQLELPTVPQRIAVISSSTAAGYGDFMDQLSNNSFSYQFEVQLFNATMQGKEAETSIISAMHKIFSSLNDFDLLVIIRGGGATTDLDCFDNYELCAHVAQFPIPVITGIGHDRDETICDMVAHTNLKTPTAVSEFLITGIKNYEDQLDAHFSALYHHLNQSLALESLQLEKLISRLQRTYQDATSTHSNYLDKLLYSLQINSKSILNSQKDQLVGTEELIKNNAPKLLKTHQEKLHSYEKLLEAVDPDQVLKRGYTITKINGEHLLNYSKEIKNGDAVETHSLNQTLISELKEITKRIHKNGEGKI